MQLSLPKDRLAGYVSRQLNALFPDGTDATPQDLEAAVAGALERLEFCFRRVRIPHYCRDGVARFNHLYSDQYLVFLWMLSNESWQRGLARGLLDKLYLLNKALHGFDCLYDNPLPRIFIVIHGAGTVLGKARYEDFLTVYQGCTVGQSRDEFPVLGRGAGLAAGAQVIGRCTLGEYASVGAGCTLVNTAVPDGASAYRDDDGRLRFSTATRAAIASRCFADEYLFGAP